MKHLLIIIILTTSLFSSERIIVNNNTADNLSKSDINKIYLGKKRWWTNHKKIIILSFYNGEIGESFSKNYLRKGLSEVIIYWKQLMFTGRSSMPKEIKTEVDMVNYIKDNDGAIGYVSENIADSLLSSVRVIKININD